MTRLIFIHGISTSSKTTTSNLLTTTEQYGSSVVLDQDLYLYNSINNDVMYTVSTNLIGLNNYVINSINFDTLNTDIELALNFGVDYVIVVGFALLEKYIKYTPNISILLEYNLNDELALQEIANRRAVTSKYFKFKNFTVEMIIENIILPFYLYTLSSIKVDHVVGIYKDGCPLSPENLVNEIINTLS